MNAMPAAALGPAGAPAIPVARHTYVAQLDALRAIAVLAVMMFHLDATWLPGGFVGVDIFFVLSGYVVSASLLETPTTSIMDFVKHFYAKRILRIVPALMLCLLVTALLTTLFIPNSWLSSGSRKALLMAFFGVSNFAMMSGGDTYFSPRTEFNAATHTWSLGVEEQFYLVFPLIWFFWVRSRRAMPASRLHWPGALLAFVVCGSVAYSLWASLREPVAGYYAMPSRFWELGAGALLLQWHRGGRFMSGRLLRHDAVLAGAVLLLALAVGLSTESPFPVPWALPAVAGSLLFIDAVMAPQGEGSRLKRIFGLWLLPAVGRISYSLYLWHWPVYVLLRWTTGLDGTGPRATAVLATFACAIGSYLWLERPLRRSPTLLSRPSGFVVLGGAVVVGLSAAVALVIFSQQPRVSLSVTRDVAAWYPYAWHGKAADGCEVGLASEPLLDGMVMTGKRSHCSVERPARTLYVLGDSHAPALSSLLSRVAAEKNVDIVLYTRPGCAFLDLMTPLQPACQPFAERASRELRSRAKPGDWVLLASLRVPRLGDQWTQFDETAIEARQREPETVRQRQLALREAERWISDAQAAGLRVVIPTPYPVFKAPAFRCADWFNRDNPICAPGLGLPREAVQRHRQFAQASLHTLATARHELRVWDGFNVLCPGAVCQAVDAEGPLFFDGDHLSGRGNMLLYDSFLAALDLR